MEWIAGGRKSGRVPVAVAALKFDILRRNGCLGLAAFKINILQRNLFFGVAVAAAVAGVKLTFYNETAWPWTGRLKNYFTEKRVCQK